VYASLVSAFVARREELVLKRLRTGELGDSEILAGTALPACCLGLAQSLLLALACALVLDAGAPGAVSDRPGSPVGLVLCAALAALTASFTRTAESAQVTALPVVFVSMLGRASCSPPRSCPTGSPRLANSPLPRDPLVQGGWSGSLSAYRGTRRRGDRHWPGPSSRCWLYGGGSGGNRDADARGARGDARTQEAGGAEEHPAKVETYTRWTFHFFALIEVAAESGSRDSAANDSSHGTWLFLLVCAHALFGAVSVPGLDWTSGAPGQPVRLLTAYAPSPRSPRSPRSARAERSRRARSAAATLFVGVLTFGAAPSRSACATGAASS